MSLNYLDEGAFALLARGHTFDAKRCVSLIDETLTNFNRVNNLPDRIAAELAVRPCMPMPKELFRDEPRMIIELSNWWKEDKTSLVLAKVFQSDAERGVAPALFLDLRSLVLDVPMRVEIPLRALFKNGANLGGAYAVYLHALVVDDGDVFQYYGITGRPWNLRFMEHVNAGQRKGRASRRLFAKKLAELIEARLDQRLGQSPSGPALAGLITTLCLVGGTKVDCCRFHRHRV